MPKWGAHLLSLSDLSGHTSTSTSGISTGRLPEGTRDTENLPN